MSITKVSPDLLDLDAGITISVADNSDTLTLTSTDADATSGPVLNLYRNSASAADGDILGLLKFTGNSGGSGVHNYGQIRMENNGVTDGQEQGKLIFEVSMTDGTLAKCFNVGRTEVSVNEDSKDLDFRVESDGNTHAFFVQGSSSNVGIGTSSPDGTLHLKGSSDTYIYQEAGASDGNAGVLYQNNSGQTRGYIIYDTDDDILIVQVNQAERLRIRSNGRQMYNGSSTYNGHGNFVGEVGSNSKALSFEHTNGGGEVGSITTGSSSTAFNTSSDYRLKENVDYTWDATTRLKQLKPARFNFIVDETNTLVDGFLAHEVSSIVPEAITGDKDAVDSDGNPEYQGIDQSKLVPLLVKTIQELEARITTLEG